MEPVIVNEQILDTLANVGITLAAFSGLVVTFRARGSRGWSATEIRVLWFLIIDSFLVVIFALLPVPLALAGWSADSVWGTTGALLGLWFLVGGVIGLVGDIRERASQHWVAVPWFTVALYGIYIMALCMGSLLLLSVTDLIVDAIVRTLHALRLGPASTGPAGGLVPRGQALFVAGLITLLAFAAAEFLYFIGLMVQGRPPRQPTPRIHGGKETGQSE